MALTYEQWKQQNGMLRGDENTSAEQATRDAYDQYYGGQISTMPLADQRAYYQSLGINDDTVKQSPTMRQQGITGLDQWIDARNNGNMSEFGLAKGDPMGNLVLAGILAMGAAGMAGMLPGTTPIWGAPAATTAATAGGPPSSYWSTLADAGGTASDAAPAAAGAVGGSPATYSIADLGLSPEAMNATSEFGGSLATGADLATANALTAGGTLAGPALAAGAGAAGTMALSDLAKYGLIGSAIQGGVGALASKSAADTAAGAANNATQAQVGMFNTINGQQAPYREAGYTALNDIAGMKPYFTHQFDANDLKTNLAPNYNFMLEQGLRATTNQLNKGGGLYGGNTLKGIADYAENYAGNAYQQAFSNYTANQTNIFNRLSNIAGLGQTANANTGAAGASISPDIASSTIAGGQAQAAGTIGMANSVSNAGNNAMGWYALPQLLNYGRVQ